MVKRRGIVARRRCIDGVMLVIIIALLTFGSVMVLSAGYPYALKTYGDGYYFAKRQVFWALFGGVGMTVCIALGEEFHKRYTAKIGFAVATFLDFLFNNP